MTDQVLNPATGQLEREYATATDAEIGEILARAGRGYLAWRRTDISERADVLGRVAQLHQDRAGELGAIVTREMGKTTADAKGEIELTVDIYRYYAGHGADLLKDEPLQSNTPGSAWVRRSPIGALLGIMPWNYPSYQVARFAAPNLMTGNTIVLKHAPRPGAFVKATVLSGVTPEMRAYHGELFGPVAAIYKLAGAEEAIELANSSSYGLGCAVFASDESLALEVADRLDVGMVWINQREGGGPELPFGGTKRSGIGRELGPLGIDEFVNKKLMHTPPDTKQP
jgi:acyl-CoA reductase-like NAD-dependent aldehyde dehydrogenase